MKKPGAAKMLQVLYDHEFSFQIVAQWDGGFEWLLGWNRGVDEKASGCTRTAMEAIEKLFDAAVHYSAQTSEELRLSLLKSLWESE